MQKFRSLYASKDCWDEDEDDCCRAEHFIHDKSAKSYNTDGKLQQLHQKINQAEIKADVQGRNGNLLIDAPPALPTLLDNSQLPELPAPAPAVPVEITGDDSTPKPQTTKENIEPPITGLQPAIIIEETVPQPPEPVAVVE